jgi:hypothetical protein
VSKAEVRCGRLVVFVPSCGFRIALVVFGFLILRKTHFAEEIYTELIRGYGINVASSGFKVSQLKT